MLSIVQIELMDTEKGKVMDYWVQPCFVTVAQARDFKGLHSEPDSGMGNKYGQISKT